MQIKRKNRSNRLILPIGTFLFIFIVLILYFKLFGAPDRYNVFSYESGVPYSWNDIYNNIYYFIVTSLFLTIFFLLVTNNVKKNKEKRIEAARKRIAEREKERKNMKK